MAEDYMTSMAGANGLRNGQGMRRSLGNRRMQGRANGGPVSGSGGDMDIYGDPSSDEDEVEFPMPESLDIPQGKTGDVVCTIRNNGGGMACLVAVEGVPLESGEKPMPSSGMPMDEEEEGEEPDLGTEGNMRRWQEKNPKEMS